MSGRTTTAAGLPARDVTVRITVTKDCFPTSPVTVAIFDWFGSGTSNAAGDYVATAILNNLEQCTLSFPFRFQAGSFSCPKDRTVPCYTGTSTMWTQSDLAPKTGVDLLVTKRGRIFGQILFPSGTAPLGPTVLLASIGSAVDAQGRFVSGPLDPGSYTVLFRPEQCASSGLTGCNGQYDFSPGEQTVTIVADEDVDVEFTATPKP